MDVKEIDKEIKKIKAELKKLRGIRKFIEETECPPCDFAVAASMIAQCYPDPDKGQRMREKYLKGEITLKELMKGMQTDDEGCKYVYDFINEHFKYVMDTTFDEWEE